MPPPSWHTGTHCKPLSYTCRANPISLAVNVLSGSRRVLTLILCSSGACHPLYCTHASTCFTPETEGGHDTRTLACLVLVYSDVQKGRIRMYTQVDKSPCTPPSSLTHYFEAASPITILKATQPDN